MSAPSINVHRSVLERPLLDAPAENSYILCADDAKLKAEVDRLKVTLLDAERSTPKGSTKKPLVILAFQLPHGRHCVALLTWLNKVLERKFWKDYDVLINQWKDYKFDFYLVQRGEACDKLKEILVASLD